MSILPLRRILGTCLAFFAFVVHQNADTLDVWKWRNPAPNGNSSFQVQFLNGQFVAYGSVPEVLTSPDGTNWADIPIPFNGAIKQMAYGNGKYVAVGSTQNGPITSSADLVNWTSANAVTNNLLSSVAFGNGVFVAGSATVPGTLVSTNGFDWSQTSTDEVFDIAYGNGRFIAAPHSPQTAGLVSVSTDGISWSHVTIDSSNFFYSVSFADGRFCAHGTHSVQVFEFPALYSSTDGSNWNLVPDPTGGTFAFYPFHALFGNGILLGEIVTAPSAPTVGPLFVSPDETNFAAIAAPSFSNVGFSAFGNGVFVNSYLQTSVDATNWSGSAISPTNGWVQDIFTTTNGYVAVTSNLLLFSSNGLKFSVATNLPPVNMSRVKSANGLCHGVGPNGGLARSTNGLDWVVRNSATANSLWDITYGNSMWVAVGTNGTIITSSTGNAWSLQTSGTSLGLAGIAYGNNLFVAVGQSGTILTSPNGTTWTSQFSDTLESLSKIVYGNGQFVAVGTHGKIIVSTNATDWFNRNSGVEADLSGIDFGDGMFGAAGAANYTNVVLTSTNALSWMSRRIPTAPSLYGNTSIRFWNGTFFLMSDNGILQSGPIQPVQLQLTLGGAAPTITMQSTTGLLFRLLSAEDSLGPWHDLGLFTTPSNGSIVFPDASASGQPRKFYRATAP